MELAAFFDEVEAQSLSLGKQAIDFDHDVPRLARLLANLRLATAQLRDVAQDVEDELVKAMTGKEAVVENLGVIDVHSGAKRTAWQSDDLQTACAHAIAHDMSNPLIDSATGEKLDTIALVQGVLARFRVAATPSWKVTGLRPMGIDPSEFCETSWGRKTVTVPPLEHPVEV